MSCSKIAVAALALTAVAGCSDVSFDDPLDRSRDAADRVWRGDVDARECDGVARSVPSAACLGVLGAPARAIAVCGDLQADNTVTLAPRSGTDGAMLAVTGRSRIAAPLRVGGSFTSVGGIEANNTEDVAGTLRTGGTWSVSAPARVRGDAYASRLEAKNTVTIDGTLHVESSVGDGITSGALRQGAVAVVSPLDCTRAPNVEGMLREARAVATDAPGIPRVLVVDEPSRVRLGCAHYHFESFTVENELTLRVEGATTISIDRDLRIASPMRIELAEGSSLELVVGGALRVDNTFDVGGGGAFAWIAVGGPVRIAAPTRLDGWLVAPRSQVDLDNTLTLRGAAYVGNLRVAAPLVVDDGPGLSEVGCLVPDASWVTTSARAR